MGLINKKLIFGFGTSKKRLLGIEFFGVSLKYQIRLIVSAKVSKLLEVYKERGEVYFSSLEKREYGKYIMWTYQAMRAYYRLPGRGQRTQTNSRTARRYIPITRAKLPIVNNDIDDKAIKKKVFNKFGKKKKYS